MSEWIEFDRWPECVNMERPGIVFEVVNAEDQKMFTNCVVPLELPFDWKSEPVRFRARPEREPRHSTPIPEPVKPR
jgi:hypothetical protein